MTLARRRLVRVPASSANLGPGFDAFAAALALHLELEVVETGTFSVRTELDVPRDRSNLVVQRVRAAPLGGRIRVPDQFGDPAERRAGVERGGDRGRADGRRSPVRARCRRARARKRARGAPRQRGRGARGRVRGVRRVHARAPVRAADGPGGGARRPRRGGRDREGTSGAAAEVPIQDAVFNIAHGALLMLGIGTGNWELIAEGLDDRLHQPYRAHLYPRSADLVEHARDMGALGATFSGAGPTILVWCQFEHTGTVIDSLAWRHARVGASDPRAVRVPGRGRARALAAFARGAPGATPRGAPGSRARCG